MVRHTAQSFNWVDYADYIRKKYILLYLMFFNLQNKGNFSNKHGQFKNIHMVIIYGISEYIKLNTYYIKISCTILKTHLHLKLIENG